MARNLARRAKRTEDSLTRAVQTKDKRLLARLRRNLYARVGRDEDWWYQQAKDLAQLSPSAVLELISSEPYQAASVEDRRGILQAFREASRTAAVKADITKFILGRILPEYRGMEGRDQSNEKPKGGTTIQVFNVERGTVEAREAFESKTSRSVRTVKVESQGGPQSLQGPQVDQAVP